MLPGSHCCNAIVRHGSSLSSCKTQPGLTRRGRKAATRRALGRGHKALEADGDLEPFLRHLRLGLQQQHLPAQSRQQPVRHKSHRRCLQRLWQPQVLTSTPCLCRHHPPVLLEQACQGKDRSQRSHFVQVHLQYANDPHLPLVCGNTSAPCRPRHAVLSNSRCIQVTPQNM